MLGQILAIVELSTNSDAGSVNASCNFSVSGPSLSNESPDKSLFIDV